MKNFPHGIILIITLLTTFPSIASDSCWVQIRIPVACMREQPSHASEMSTQFIMGTPMIILDDEGEWLRLKGPDSYEGYVNVSSLARKSHTEICNWRKSPRLVVTTMPEVKIYSSPDDTSARKVVTELVNGSIVEGSLSDKALTKITLPDGRQGWAATGCLTPIEEWASQPFSAEKILDRCYWLTGSPYLWGACSTKSVDCSGLVRVAYFANGILTVRDARQQISIGKRIEPSDTSSLKQGDLLFFSNTPDGRISHVALYDADRYYIHSSGRVKVNRMDPSDPDFSSRYYRGASRIDGMIPSDGITSVKLHPWYF